MRLSLAVLAVAAVLGLEACQSQAGGGAAAGLADADRTAIKAVFDSVVAQVRARNNAAWAANFTEDATFQPPNHPAIHGRANLKAWADSFPAMTAFDFPNVSIDGAGDLAYGTSEIQMTISLPGVPSMTDKAKQLVVLRKQTDGSWKVVVVAFNSDLPLPAAPATPAPRKGK